jgi:hypothetical protein
VDAHAAFRVSKLPSFSVKTPELFKPLLSLFKYSRQTLEQWQASMPRKGETLDFAAAAFANRVVRFLEGSCHMVGWTPVSDSIGGLGDFDVARRRWAVVL